MNKQDIVNLLKSNDRAIARALVVLNERQTYDEQLNEATKYHNGVGFTGCDARMGTSMAQYYLKHGRLSDKQLAYWKKPNKNGVWRICKYAGQLLEIALEKSRTMQTAMEDRLQEKAEFAQQEALQEQQAFLAKMRRDDHLTKAGV